MGAVGINFVGVVFLPLNILAYFSKATQEDRREDVYIPSDAKRATTKITGQRNTHPPLPILFLWALTRPFFHSSYGLLQIDP
ncbi:hypothetical protein SAY87_030500 [Trapa incisa]|uniref:Uncharacterized protein n=1 Tax=Trapa incisa TaxID=236973 RepID=A0AAN7QLV0_9MYRT|nr:hypothetical protein SAY87_030500 [Trapa incisa]